jgi:hypothetical protein
MKISNKNKGASYAFRHFRVLETGTVFGYHTSGNGMRGRGRRNDIKSMIKIKSFGLRFILPTLACYTPKTLVNFKPLPIFNILMVSPLTKPTHYQVNSLAS